MITKNITNIPCKGYWRDTKTCRKNAKSNVSRCFYVFRQEFRFIIIKRQPVFGNPMESVVERIGLPKLFKISLGSGDATDTCIRVSYV